MGHGAFHCAYAARQNSVNLWAFEKEVVESIQKVRINQAFLPGHGVSQGGHRNQRSGTALKDAELLVGVMPSHHCRRIVEQMVGKKLLRESVPFVSATKGIEQESLLRMTEVVTEVVSRSGFQPRVAAVSGPSFAIEVAKGDPTAITVASGTANWPRWCSASSATRHCVFTPTTTWSEWNLAAR